MNRRRFVRGTIAVGTLGLLAGCLSEAENGSTTEDESPDESTTDESTTTEEPPTTGTDRPGGEYSDEGAIDGVPFAFSADPPKCSTAEEIAAIDMADIAFDSEAGEIVVKGVIGGSDLCTGARLADLTYDRAESHLSIAIESTNREGCDAGGQCIAGVAYEGTFSFEDGIPDGASVSHDGRGVTAAAYGSASAGPPSETTAE